MIEPLYLQYGGSLEGEVAEWVEQISLCGWADDYDGSDRPGLAAAICEDLPSNETPTTMRWDPAERMVEAWCKQFGHPLAYWFFGATAYRQLMVGGAASN